MRFGRCEAGLRGPEEGRGRGAWVWPAALQAPAAARVAAGVMLLRGCAGGGGPVAWTASAEACLQLRWVCVGEPWAAWRDCRFSGCVIRMDIFTAGCESIWGERAQSCAAALGACFALLLLQRHKRAGVRNIKFRIHQ